MGFDPGFLRDYGIDVTSGIEYTGGQDRYVSALFRFYKNYENNCEKIRSFFEKKDLENITVLVHAMKSNCRMVGATELSTEFEALEYAGREGKLDVIEADTEKVLSRYSAFVKLLEPISRAEITIPADELTKEEALQVLEKLLAALDDFDDELSMSLVKKLSGYPFRPGPKEKLQKAQDNIEKFLYDEAAEIIRDIEKTIE